MNIMMGQHGMNLCLRIETICGLFCKHLLIFLFHKIRNFFELALTSPTGGGRSVGIVHLRIKATAFFYGTFLTNLELCSSQN